MRASDPGENPHAQSVADQIAELIEDIEDHLGERSDVDELVGRDEHASFVRSVEDDPDLATT